MTEPRTDGSRPLLVAFTQIFLVLIVCTVIYTLRSGIVEAFRGELSGHMTPQLLIGLLRVIALIIPFAVLFYGLARRRRWSWVGSIAFAVLLTGWAVSLEVTNPDSPFRASGTRPGGHLGGIVAASAVPAIFGLYAFLLYRSSRVRAFLGVRQRHTASEGKATGNDPT